MASSNINFIANGLVYEDTGQCPRGDGDVGSERLTIPRAHPTIWAPQAVAQQYSIQLHRVLSLSASFAKSVFLWDNLTCSCTNTDGHPSESTMSCLLTIFALPAALIPTITKRLETHADICLSTEMQPTSLISVYAEVEGGECAGGGEVEMIQRKTDSEKDDQAARVTHSDN